MEQPSFVVNNEVGFVADTPESIELMGLLYLVRDLKIGKAGIGLRYSPRKLAKRMTGLKTNDYDKLLAGVEELIQEKRQNPASRFKRI